MTTGVAFVVRAVDLRVRPVRLRLPFRFGANTLTACPQLFVRVEIDVPGHCSGRGFAAEMMVPKWFDKRADRSADDNIADLRAGDPRRRRGVHERRARDLVRPVRAPLRRADGAGRGRGPHRPVVRVRPGGDRQGRARCAVPRARHLVLRRRAPQRDRAGRHARGGRHGGLGLVDLAGHAAAAAPHRGAPHRRPARRARCACATATTACRSACAP